VKRRRRAKLPEPLESVIQADIMALLHAYEPRWLLAERTNAGTIYGEKGAVKLGRPGTSDIKVYLPAGRVAHLEVKRPSGKLRPSQQDWRDKLRMLGHDYHVVRSVWDVVELLKTWLEDQGAADQAPVAR